MEVFIMQYWLEVLFGAIVTFLGVFYKNLAARYKVEKEQMNELRAQFQVFQQSINETFKDMLFDQIVRSHNYHVRNGWIEVEELRAFITNCERHSLLGGNGTTKILRERVEQLEVLDATECMKMDTIMARAKMAHS